MGGCYSDYERSSRSSSRNIETHFELLKKFRKTGDHKELVAASRAFSSGDLLKKGFIKEVAKAFSVQTDKEGIPIFPKEFPQREYEVKFDIVPYNGADERETPDSEPSVVEYLDAFDFPVGLNTRFFKDPVNNFAEGMNSFMGDDKDERLVIIEKAGGMYLKEKGRVEPVSLGVPYEEIIVKRTEERYPCDIESLLDKTREVTSEDGVKYRGKLRKEKGDVFILDSEDGRVYSFTVTRAHLIRPGEEKESAVQRQLEIEYAGYVPGFSESFALDSEPQVISGMIDLAKYTSLMYNNGRVSNGWKMGLGVTSERKYDFVLNGGQREFERTGHRFSEDLGQLLISSN